MNKLQHQICDEALRDPRLAGNEHHPEAITAALLATIAYELARIADTLEEKNK
jgi:hypothetical protein